MSGTGLMALFLLGQTVSPGLENLTMIRLTLSGAAAASEVTLSATIFRVTGGIVWDQLGHLLIAHYSDGLWIHETRRFRHLAFDGPCRLAFGLSRDPAAITEPVESLLISGSVLRVNGVPVAQYVPNSDMWRGIFRQSWWMALQIVMADQFPKLEENPAVQVVDLWGPMRPKTI
jgi:hypothetical protein